MAQDWDDRLIALLHDPPDKALDPRGNENRAGRYLTAVLDRQVEAGQLHGLDDQLASVAERLPLPVVSEDVGHEIHPVDGELLANHPLSGDQTRLAVPPPDEETLLRTLQDIVAGLDTPRDRCLAVWRLLPDRLAAQNPCYARLPADARVPDHTVWHHQNVTVGLATALAAPAGAAFLAFALGPVQPFIAAARSVRDLWTGSLTLSWLTFQALLPIVRRLGPMAIAYPALRTSPLLDLWLRRDAGLGDTVELPPESVRRTPCLPHRFLAVVPNGTDGEAGQELARDCEVACRQAWQRLAESVRVKLAPVMERHDAAWDRRWQQQIESFFDVRTAVLPWRGTSEEGLARLLAGEDHFEAAFPEARAVRRLADAIPPDHAPAHPQKSAGDWQAKVEFVLRLLAAGRSVRHVPPSTQPGPAGRVPPKCSLLGSYEQMGPDNLQESARFWQAVEAEFRERGIDGVRLRPRERFCAVSLVKRFAEPAFLARELELDVRPVPDTATVAGAVWLQDVNDKGIALAAESPGWSGQWLHWPHRDFDPDEPAVPGRVWALIEQARRHPDLRPPPAYYAILVMDGDEMGRWLQGEKSPRVGDVLHPELRRYFEGLGPVARDGLQARQPVGPALHAAISEALTNFALHAVPQIVNKHHGMLIYAGGDDVLALLPVATALACAHELRLAFSGDESVNGGAPAGYYRHGGRDLLVMGPQATASSGLAVVHYKEDLRFALDTARRAENAAKQGGRDALEIAICRRSGEHTTACCPWGFVPTVTAWSQAFQQRASDRWTYHLRRELSTLQGLPVEAVQAEIRRQVDRAEDSTRRLLGTGETIAGQFDAYRGELAPRPVDESRVLGDFIALCQSASFLARGRDA